jgi:NitT/TauT family transport system permease protein
MNGRKWLSRALPIAVALIVLGGWEALCRVLTLPVYFLPAPSDVWLAAWTEREILWQATLNTALVTALGFPLAALASTGLALILCQAAWVRASLFPYLMVAQMTPIIVVAPILLLWFGSGLVSTTLITFLVSFFPLVVNTTQGLISTDRNLVDLFRMSKATRWQEIALLRVPAALPYFFTGLRISAILAPIGAVVGDFFAGNSGNGVGGLGFRTVIYSSQLKTPALFATAALCCLLGFLLVSIVYFLDWLCLHKWHDSYAQHDR